MRKLCALALVMAFVAAPVSAAEKGGGSTRYFIEADASQKEAHVSLAVKGNKLVSGYVVEKINCPGYPDVRFNYIDFGHTEVKNGRFRDVDRKSFYRDRVTGTIGADSVRGQVRSRFDFTSPGPVCKTGERFQLEQVDKARWARYTKKARKADSEVPGDSRVAAAGR